MLMVVSLPEMVLPFPRRSRRAIATYYHYLKLFKGTLATANTANHLHKLVAGRAKGDKNGGTIRRIGCEITSPAAGSGNQNSAYHCSLRLDSTMATSPTYCPLTTVRPESRSSAGKMSCSLDTIV